MAAEVCELKAERCPAVTVNRRKQMERVALASAKLPSLEKMRMLTVLRDWETLDAVLATKMHLLAVVPRQVRGCIIVHRPKEL